ncbi:type IV-A pilus assembly ATPase PilB [Rheinheimera tangshanensis]|uniref:Type IV-A pilus assembly ATPase PilB n=1 Tax=Rheinheimera tangshanensis TaxID=400153 RepID=A0A5C8LZU6_9GAMM|nr:type IV-A pilus assembly ATPase PilB [Rheinheimera tangshanensis]MBP8227384.1 type IV-A pilus assembly ATPase PilB [Rheinheimera sp.]TXK82387.1 type IV-A pilus assembly ATPase PilB [Rheinheimera tangshanensis]GGM54453.1 type IV-A pilus assembly ATPase PilB [Rheinheimera tangshanensis]
MALNPSSILLRRLQQANLVDPQITAKLLQEKSHQYQTIADLLIGEKLLQAKALAEAAAAFTLHSALDLDFFDINTVPESLRNEKLIRKHHILPLAKRHKTLFLAVVDPTDMTSVEDFEFNTGLNAEMIVVEFDKLHKAIDKLFETTATDSFTDTQWDLAKMGLASGEEEDTKTVGSDSEDQPIISFINKMLHDAIRKGASDLHFEPYEKSYRIRFRIDGILHEVASPPVALSTRLSARLKVMSRLDIAEKRVPQDGRIKLKLSQKKSIDFRVSTLPTLWGEKIVMRILDSDSAMLGIDILGYEPEQKQLYLNALAQPQGMILVTGPTGSGKTVSLYTGLNILNTEETNISTAEDPVEINLPGINQVQVNPRAGLTFPSALKAFLRQDPDVIMVGEIRDLETAEIAIKAAQTGHLVLSTLHTNSAPETLTRLLNMGVPAYNVASSVTLIIAQRLARRLCNHCKAAEQLPEQEAIKQGFTASQISQLKLFKPVGCDHCTGGYKGRLGIYEVLPITAQIAAKIMAGANSLDIAAQAQIEGFPNLRQSALKKAAAGLTSLAEVNRVTNA